MDKATEGPLRAPALRGARALLPHSEHAEQLTTMGYGGALPGILQGEELTDQPDRPGYVDVDRSGCLGHASALSFAPREVLGLLVPAESAIPVSVRGVLRAGDTGIDSDAEPACRSLAAHGERGLPSREDDDEWMRVAAAATTAAELEEWLDHELFFGDEAADSEQERDAHCARLSELHRAACLRRTSGPAFKHQVGSGNARTTLAGLADAAAAVHRCRRPGCHALVDAGRARAAACKRSDGSFNEGDGCAGPRCATRWRPDRYVPRQCALAYNLFHGRRRLADWPLRVGGGSGTRRSRASGARAALLALAWLRELGLYEFE